MNDRNKRRIKPAWMVGKRTPATAEDIKKQKEERKKREEEKMRLRAELHKKSKERREKIRKAKGGLVKKK